MTQFTHFDIVHTHFGTVYTLFTSYDTVHTHFLIDHTHFDTVHTHFGTVHTLFTSYYTVHIHIDIVTHTFAQLTHCSQAMTQLTHTLT